MFRRALLASGALLVAFASCKADSGGLFEPLPNAGGAGGSSGGSPPLDLGPLPPPPDASVSIPEGQGGSLGLMGGAGSGGAGSNAVVDAGLADAGDAGPSLDAAVLAPVEPPCSDNAEVCDGLDNDCDDAVDEGAACAGDCAGFALAGRGYMFCSDDAVRDDAVARCQLEGMRLAWIETPEENAFLVDRIESADVPASTSEEILTLIGGSDAAAEGRWIWRGTGAIADGVQFWQGQAAANGGQAVGGAYSNWSDTEPNNTDDDENCAVMSVLGNNNRAPGNWDDRACDGLLPFVCEVP